MVSFWRVTGTSIFDPYPCRCHERKYSRCSPKWCVCSGRIDLWWLPTSCCAHGNPARLPPEVWALATGGLPPSPASEPVPLPRPQTAGARSGPQSPAGGAVAPEATDGRWLSDPDETERRWPPELLTCQCRTPWDDVKRGGGFHCPDCHNNFQSAICYQMHRKWATQECRDPGDILDVDTGEQILGLGRVGGFPVWYWAWRTRGALR
jgi:hypothetical protein